MAAMVEVSVIVPARDAEGTIGATLAAVARLQFDSKFEVIVVDNGSLDATEQVARASEIQPTVISRTRGDGPGGARNAGAEAANGRVLAFMDADCEPDPQWLAFGMEAMREADLVQGRVVPVRPPGPFDRTIWVSGENGLYETSNLLIRRDLFQRLGGFAEFVDPARESPFGEDVLLGWAARRAGARTAFEERAVVRHAVFPRGPGAYIWERWRLRMFPALVREVPELRRRTFFLRYFLNRRTAALDAGLAGIAVALTVGSPVALLAAVPYLWIAGRGALRWRRHAGVVAAVSLVADLIGCAALLWGSARSRRVLV